MKVSDISAARPEDQREVLEAVWDIIACARGFAWAAGNAQAFTRKLDAQAYLDAAMMMVAHEGWEKQVITWDSRSAYATICPPEAEDYDDAFSAKAATPALALCAAILQAQSKDHEHE